MPNERTTARTAVYGSEPRVLAVANHIHREGATPYPYIVTFLGTIDAKFPGLSFHDFLNAVRLSDFTNQQPSGSA